LNFAGFEIGVLNEICHNRKKIAGMKQKEKNLYFCTVFNEKAQKD